MSISPNAPVISAVCKCASALSSDWMIIRAHYFPASGQGEYKNIYPHSMAVPLCSNVSTLPNDNKCISYTCIIYTFAGRTELKGIALHRSNHYIYYKESLGKGEELQSDQSNQSFILIMPLVVPLV